LITQPVSAATSTNKLPDMSEAIDCIRDGNCLLVPVTINNRSCLMLFDTGADSIAVSRTTLTALGISLPSTTSAGAVKGVGTNSVTTSRSTATVKIGNYLRENFLINIQETSPTQPIIGSSFFQNCSITVDMRHSRIILNRQIAVACSPTSVRSDITSVTVKTLPHGNQLLVPVRVNNCSINMLLDSGSDGITFSKEQAATIHLVVPQTAQSEVHLGIAGAVKGVGFNVGEFAVGPLVKRNVKVSVIESPGMPYPLMGAEFLKDCTYTINKEHSQITFEII
jgi:predicted aspartyl protease